MYDMYPDYDDNETNPYCDYSGLRENSCGHCLGHRLDPDLEEVVEA